MTPSAALPLPAVAPAAADRPVALWLLACCAMVFVMVVIGGITRLTESGLSITEWRPVTGILPPLSAAEWQRLFDQYRAIPEYQLVKRGMTLAEFRTIFWWEYVHRLWGRLIGLAFLLPFLWFLLRGRIRRGLAPRLAALFALGGLQGLLGWYMVQSGLADRVDVSQYRLTAHLALALVIYAGLLWLALDLLRPTAPPLPPAARAWRRGLRAWAALAVLVILAGGFVAGLKGGFVYNSFPLMGGRLVPPDLLAVEPRWANPFENPVAAQFLHRWLAVALLLAALALWLHARRVGLPAPLRRGSALLLAAMLLQAGLGLATLLLVVPIPLAAAHQGGAVLLLTLLVLLLHAARGRPARPA